MAAAALTSGPHAGRFHVTVFANNSDLSEARGGAEDFGFEVGLLDSLPWSRGDRPQTLHDDQVVGESQAVVDASECVGELTDTLTSAQDGGTLTAKVAKSLSQLRLSASNSSNFRSLDCNCCLESSQGGGACDAATGAQEACNEPQHLQPPWSINSCSWSRRSQCSRECSSSASLHQLAAAHRSERVGCRGGGGGGFRRQTSLANSGSSHNCLPECGDYMTDLQDRVQHWLSQVESEPNEGAKFFLGNLDS